MGKHYTVLVQIKEVTDSESTTVNQFSGRGVTPVTTEKPRTVHDKLNMSATEDTYTEAIQTVLGVLRLMLEGAVIDE